MRSLTVVGPNSVAQVTEHDLSWVSDERLANLGITAKELRRLFAKAWKLADRTLSEIAESPKPDLIPVAYQKSDGKWKVLLSVDD